MWFVIYVGDISTLTKMPKKTSVLRFNYIRNFYSNFYSNEITLHYDLRPVITQIGLLPAVQCVAQRCLRLRRNRQSGWVKFFFLIKPETKTEISRTVDTSWKTSSGCGCSYAAFFQKPKWNCSDKNRTMIFDVYHLYPYRFLAWSSTVNQ